MKQDYFCDVHDVQDALGVGEGLAYQIIRQINDDLKANGYITIRGKVPRKALFERLYMGETGQPEQDDNTAND